MAVFFFHHVGFEAPAHVVVLGNKQGELSGQPTVVLFVEIRTQSIA